MKNNHQDINDDEIRVISSSNKGSVTQVRNSKFKSLVIVAASIVVAVLALLSVLYIVDNKHKNIAEELPSPAPTAEDIISEVDTVSIIMDNAPEAGFVTMTDTVVNRVPLTIFTPVDLMPSLSIGTDVLNDSTAKFVVQAADVRSDNGGIVGAYVKAGELLSKGQAKSGFCAIIGGKITVGVADATPFLEQALETNGYFFRQYPLVVANQLVENKPRGKSLRKALAELNGRIAVIFSDEKMTFHDFSQSLVDLGVSNAIYLVGGQSYGFAINKKGEIMEFGYRQNELFPNTNYIVWR